MWVYGTPEAQGYWLRMMIVDGNGKNQSIDLTQNVPGIDWLGWKYVEAEIPESFTGPFKISWYTSDQIDVYKIRDCWTNDKRYNLY